MQQAPTALGDILKKIGPGLIITASIVGSGELIVTPKLAANVGYTLLWFIIIGCIIKVFVQIEPGRYAIARGLTTLEAMNTIPGPRLVVSWLFMYVALIFQLAGIVGGIADIFKSMGSTWSDKLWALLTGGSCALLLVLGRYKWVEFLSTVMVVAFTVCTIVAVGSLQWTPYAISSAEIGHGLSFHLPANFTVAFAAFGIIGVGASELIYYPYWCLEKGYAKFVGPREATPAWRSRARGWIKVMHVDAWVSMVIYTGATVAFYLLGAAVLHGKGLDVTNIDLIATLSHMYRETFGAWGFWIFLIGAFNVLYSTVFVAMASNARLLADALSVFGVKHYRSPEHKQQFVKLGCVVLPALSVLMYCLWKAPVSLVFVGALAQGVMIPFLAGAALYFHFRHTDDEVRPGLIWRIFLVTASVAMAAVGIYHVMAEISKRAAF